MRSPDVLIIGAGIVGAACAAEFAAAGLSVAVVERGVPGGGATAAGMGHIVVMDDSPAQRILTRYSRALWDERLRDRPEAHEYDRCGTLWVAADAEDLGALAARHAAGEAEGELLDERSLRACEPELRPGLAGGLLVAGDGVVYPPRSAELWLRASGAAVVAGGAAGLLPGGAGVTLSDGRRLPAGAVVLAAGAQARELAPDLPLQPRKGHLAITDRHPGFLRHQVIETGYASSARDRSAPSVAFNVQPRPTGQMLIGSSRQPGDATAAVDAPLLGRMLARAAAFLPGLAYLSCIRAWTGVRSASPDGLPLIGPHPARPGLWIAAGHEGLGITLAPATARLLADLMLGRHPAIPAAPYLPARLLG